MLDERQPGARAREARECRRRPVQVHEQHGPVLGRRGQHLDRALHGPKLRQQVPFRPRLAHRQHVLQRLLHQEQRLSGLEERRHCVDLLVERPGRLRGSRDRPQQVHDVAHEVETGRAAVAIRLQPLPGAEARGRAVGLEQVQELPPAVAPLLGLQLVQQPVRSKGPEEAQHRAQEEVALGPLGQLADAVLRQVLVARDDHRLDERGLDLALRDHLPREIEHLQRSAVRALVELVDRSVHHLAEAPAGLGRLVGERDHPAHRAHLAAFGERRDVGDGRKRPARHAPRERPEHLVRTADEAEPADAVEVLLQLGAVLRLQRSLEHRVRHERATARRGRLRRPVAGALALSWAGVATCSSRCSSSGRRPRPSTIAESTRGVASAACCALAAAARATGSGAPDWRCTISTLLASDCRDSSSRESPSASCSCPSTGQASSKSGPSVRRYASSSGAPISSKSPMMWILRAEWNSSSPSASAPPWTSTCRTHQFTICWAAKAGGQPHHEAEGVEGHERSELVGQVLAEAVQRVLELGGIRARGFVAHWRASGRYNHTIIPGPTRQLLADRPP